MMPLTRDGTGVAEGDGLGVTAIGNGSSVGNGVAAAAVGAGVTAGLAVGTGVGMGKKVIDPVPWLAAVISAV
jgi:hypothetical protein